MVAYHYGGPLLWRAWIPLHWLTAQTSCFSELHSCNLQHFLQDLQRPMAMRVHLRLLNSYVRMFTRRTFDWLTHAAIGTTPQQCGRLCFVQNQNNATITKPNRLKPGFHYPSWRPWTWVHFLTPVNSGRQLGCQKMHQSSRAVNSARGNRA